MIEQEARAIAAVLYYGRIDWSSEPEFGHLERVAKSVKLRAKVVAWLHDVVEDGLTNFGALKEAGISDTEYKALFLLTRMPEETYLDYIRGIVAADGEAGEIAVEVKLADNEDNCTRPCPADKQGMRAEGGRYDKARKILKGESLEGEKYGWVTILAIGLKVLFKGRFNFGVQGTSICSGLAARSLERMGYNFQPYDPAELTPAFLAKEL